MPLFFNHKIIMNKFYIKVIVTFFISFTYAIVRYNIFGNVPWVEVPLYIFNKGLSLSVVLLLFLSIIQKENNTTDKQKLWKTIFILTAIHVFISFRLLGPEYYQKFYFNNELNLFGYLALFFGISAFIGILILNSEKVFPTEDGEVILPNSLKKNIRTLIPFFVAGHLFSLGIKGWLFPDNWPGYLVPISLIAFVLIVIYIAKKKDK